MITKEFLQSCTDDQIDKGVAWLEAKASPTVFGSAYMFGEFWNGVFYAKDYCKNPNDAWPIILNSRIGIKPRGVDSDWYAYQGKIEVINSNPLRAAMEVYILMSVSK